MGGGSKFTNSNAGCYVNFMEKLELQLPGMDISNYRDCQGWMTTLSWEKELPAPALYVIL